MVEPRHTAERRWCPREADPLRRAPRRALPCGARRARGRSIPWC